MLGLSPTQGFPPMSPLVHTVLICGDNPLPGIGAPSTFFLEKAMATHSSVLAWRIPGTTEPGGLPSMGSHRVGYNWSDLAAAAAFIEYQNTLLKMWHAWQLCTLFLLLFSLARNYFLAKIYNVSIYKYRYRYWYIHQYILYINIWPQTIFSGQWDISPSSQPGKKIGE